MKAPLILVVGVLFCAVIAGLFWWGSQSVSVTVTTNALPSAPAPPPPSTQAQALFAIPPGIRQPTDEVFGIGAVIKRDDNTGENMITGVVPNSPAAAAGLAGDFIIRKIDDTLADGMSLQECVNLVRGPAGTKVRLELFDV